MKLSTTPPLFRTRLDERVLHLSVGIVVGFLLGALFVIGTRP